MREAQGALVDPGFLVLLWGQLVPVGITMTEFIISGNILEEVLEENIEDQPKNKMFQTYHYSG